MAWLGECLGSLRTTWPLRYCVHHEEAADDWPPLWPTEDKPIFFQQPILIPPPMPDFSAAPSLTRRSSITSRPRTADPRTLISRASSVASRIRKQPRRRPTIGSPSDFRRVEGTLEDLAPRPFRPLQLSIYIPGNELPPLPSFNPEDFEALRALVPPPAAHVVKRTQSDTILSRRCSSALAINPRAMALPSRPRISTAESFYSSASDDGASLSPSMLDRAHSIYVEAVSSLPQGQNHTHNHNYNPSSLSLPASQAQFLSLLDDIPRPPVPLKVNKPPLPLSLTRSRSRSPDPVRRNASDQNMRLRTHLEERQEMESRLQDFDTIMEEWENDMSVSGSTGSERQRSSLSRASSNTSTASHVSGAGSTVLSTMERTLAQRPYNANANMQYTKSAPHLPHNHSTIPASPPPMPTPPVVRKPSTHSHSQYPRAFKSFHLRSLEPPFPPPSYAPPANPEQRGPQSPGWYRRESYERQANHERVGSLDRIGRGSQEGVARGSYDKIYQRHISASGSSATLNEECPSLSSALSTPLSSPGRGYAVYERKVDGGVDGGKSPVRIEYGVAF